MRDLQFFEDSVTHYSKHSKLMNFRQLFRYSLAKSILKKTLNVKFALSIAIICVIQITTVSAQQITLKEKDCSLKKVFTEVRRQTGYNVVCTSDILNNAKPVTVNFNNTSLSEVLKQIADQEELEFNIQNKTIIVKRKTANLHVVQPQNTSPPAGILSGYVRDTLNRPILGATIKLSPGKFITATDKNGFFLIKDIPFDNYQLLITSIGYQPTMKVIAVNDKSNSSSLSFFMRDATWSLNEVTIKTEKPIGTTVDLTHKTHLNLGQVLQGSVPGLTLQHVVTTENNVLKSDGHTTVEQAYAQFQQQHPDGILYLSPTSHSLVTNEQQYAATIKIFGGGLTSVTTDNGLVPELRGAGSFTGDVSGMLVIIDGIEQKGFPSNYPMNNVLSVDVIKDPVECIKWGPKAAGGIIMITTKPGAGGKLQINYNSNFYYAPRPDISAKKLQLPSTQDVLSFDKEAVDKFVALYPYLSTPYGLTPAQILLSNKALGKISQTAFQHSWDSLSTLSNRGQLRLLQQNAFYQNQNLNITGGNKIDRFSIGGLYGTNESNVLGNKSTNIGLNLNNDLALLKGNLRIQFLLNATHTKSYTGAADDGSSLDPYQMLLDPNGNYVYNYLTVTPDQNKAMTAAGYYNYGNNPLEDARLNSNISHTTQIDSRLNINWKLNNDLQWSTALLYSRNGVTTNNLESGTSSQARQLVDNYGSPLHNNPSNPAAITGVQFYVPPGNIMQNSGSNSTVLNLRSGLIYNHRFGSKHYLNATLAAGGSSEVDNILPDTTLYGYNLKTKTGLPILPTGSTAVLNYLGSQIYPSNLLVPTQLNTTTLRNLTASGTFAYAYDNRFSLTGRYNFLGIPQYGVNPPYSTSTNAGGEAAWFINREHFFHVPWISSLKLSATVDYIKVPVAQPQETAARNFQQFWNNYYIFLSGYIPSQLNGQSVTTTGGTLQFGLDKDRLMMYVAYDVSEGQSQFNGRIAYDIAREPWFHIGAIDKLEGSFIVQNINQAQGLAIMLGTNIPNPTGGFTMATNSNYSLLPPSILNKEAHLTVGMFKDRLTLDVRYYHKVSSGLLNNSSLPTDPSTGLSSQTSYSKLLNKGVEVYLHGDVFRKKDFSYGITINGAYNVNSALAVPHVNFQQTSDYLIAARNGYATDNLWSYKWAGLDNTGNPQIYNGQGKKVSAPDSTALVYSGRTTPSVTAGFIQEWSYKNFFASARMLIKWGYVMRQYYPVADGLIFDANSYLIANRWEKPGDEAHTDIAAMAAANPVRELIIQNSTNSVLSADNIRLQEIQFGYDVPAKVLKGWLVKQLTLSVQMENVALWTRNKYHIDPDAISSNGIIRASQPQQYILSINASF